MQPYVHIVMVFLVYQIDRQANTLPRRMVTLTAPTIEQRQSYELQFSSLHPIGGYITGQ